MAVTQPASALPGTEPNLLLEWPERRTRSGWTIIFASSFALHLFLFAVATQVPGLVGVAAPAPPRAIVHKTILYMPRDLLTQKAPNTRKPNQNVDLQSLLSVGGPQTQRPTPARSTRHFEIPKLAQPAPPSKVEPQIVAQAPPVAPLPQSQPATPPPSGSSTGLVAANPKPAPPVSQPFQNLGSDEPVQRPDKPTIAVPKGGMQGVLQNLAQTPNGQHLIISDDHSSAAATPGAIGPNGRTAAQHSAVELESDPQGADFRAYLAQILSIVRSNWRRVTPESVQMGTLRGRTVVQFIIDRDGSIPKLVIATPSNVDALDRASVAGLSMSNPLPPLPSDYKGFQVRLAFTFNYNMPN